MNHPKLLQTRNACKQKHPSRQCDNQLKFILFFFLFSVHSALVGGKSNKISFKLKKENFKILTITLLEDKDFLFSPPLKYKIEGSEEAFSNRHQCREGQLPIII